MQGCSRSMARQFGLVALVLTSCAALTHGEDATDQETAGIFLNRHHHTALGGLPIQHNSTSCGNRAIESPGEECDDGNMADGDGCSSTCGVETGWKCEFSPSVCKLKHHSVVNPPFWYWVGSFVMVGVVSAAILVGLMRGVCCGGGDDEKKDTRQKQGGSQRSESLRRRSVGDNSFDLEAPFPMSEMVDLRARKGAIEKEIQEGAEALENLQGKKEGMTSELVSLSDDVLKLTAANRKLSEERDQLQQSAISMQREVRTVMHGIEESTDELLHLAEKAVELYDVKSEMTPRKRSQQEESSDNPVQGLALCVSGLQQRIGDLREASNFVNTVYKSPRNPHRDPSPTHSPKVDLSPSDLRSHTRNESTRAPETYVKHPSPSRIEQEVDGSDFEEMEHNPEAQAEYWRRHPDPETRRESPQSETSWDDLMDQCRRLGVIMPRESTTHHPTPLEVSLAPRPSTHYGPNTALEKDPAIQLIFADLGYRLHHVNGELYEYGERKVRLKVSNGRVLVRVGGGFMSLREWYEREKQRKQAAKSPR